MAQQAESDLNNNPFILSGISYVRNGITLAQDAGRSAVLAVRTLMAKVAVTIPTTMTADGSNTGTGTVTGVAHSATGPSPIVGTWVLTCTFAVAEGGVFKLEDPNGDIVADNLTMRVGSTLVTSFVAGGMVFSITEATDFVADDFFTLAVAADGTWVPWAVDGVDGSQIPAGILMVDSVLAATLVAGTVTDQTMLIGGTMTVASDQVIFDDGSSTLATVLPGGQTIAEALETIGIFTELTVDIASFET